MGRDPIEENGGPNLYGFCRNNSINLWDVLGMDPYGNPMNGSDVHNEVVVIDGIVYNRTWNTVGSGNEGDEYQWGDPNDEAIGTLSPDGNMDFGAGSGNDTLGISENRDGFGSLLAILPIAAVAAPRPTIQRTAQITFMVGYDSTINSSTNTLAAVQASVAQMQAVFDADPRLRHIQIVVVDGGRTPGTAPEGSYTAGPNGNTINPAIASMVEHFGPTPGTIPLLVTNNLLTNVTRGPGNRLVTSHPAGTTARGGTANAGVMVNSVQLRADVMLLAHEAGHVVGYTRPGASPTDPTRFHSNTRGNLMHNDPWLGGRAVDANYITRMRAFAIPIPRG